MMADQQVLRWSSLYGKGGHTKIHPVPHSSCTTLTQVCATVLCHMLSCYLEQSLIWRRTSSDSSASTSSDSAASGS